MLQIDDTDIIRSITAIEKYLGCPLDIDFQGEIILASNNVNSTLEYTRLTRANYSGAISILQILIEDKYPSRAERINNRRKIIRLKPGELIIVRTEVRTIQRKVE